MRHTPGPWTTDCMPSGGNESVFVNGADALVAIVPCDPESHYEGSPPREVGEANARLIAAAPELLEAARELLDFIRARFPADFGEGGKGFTCPHHIKLAAAIAKAEGKP